jgi:chromosome segregation ATPase
MKYVLNKEFQALKARIVERAEEAHSNLNEKHDEILGRIQEANELIGEFNSMIEEENQEIQELVEEMEEKISDFRSDWDDRSERWQESERGQAVETWISSLEDEFSTMQNITLHEEIDEVDEPHFECSYEEYETACDSMEDEPDA